MRGAVKGAIPGTVLGGLMGGPLRLWGVYNSIDAAIWMLPGGKLQGKTHYADMEQHYGALLTPFQSGTTLAWLAPDTCFLLQQPL